MLEGHHRGMDPPLLCRALHSTATKNSPAPATGAHISIVGHMTHDTLLRYLDRSELANGFANRS